MFMREISHLINEPSKEKGTGEVLENEDLNEDFVPKAPLEKQEDNENAYVKKQQISGLDSIDHTQVSYDPIIKGGYKEHPAVASISVRQVEDFYKKYQIKVVGSDVGKPVFDFHHLPIDINIIDKITDQGITNPTPIQSLSLPAAFLGRDILAISETASGKTLAFTLPLIYAVKSQGKTCKGEGFAGLILVPTRELCLQVYKEVKKFAAMFKLKVTALYGGVPKNTQYKELKTGCEIVVATPARLIDMVQTKVCSLKKVNFLVIDEADLMFNMGFEYQVRSILSQIRPDRQTMLYSATFRRKLELFIEEFLNNPIKISIGTSLHCNPSIIQSIMVFDHPSKKLTWLLGSIQGFIQQGLVLIFVKHRSSTEELSEILREAHIPVSNLHGDMDQSSRETVTALFRKGDLKVLVATDVASRGLNIVSISTVINYDCAKDVETHIHRIGRTGREGQGSSITLFTKFDKKFAGDLLLNLEYNDQAIPDELEKLAMEDQVFRIQRMKNDRNRVRHCKTGDFQTANKIMEKIGTKRMDLEKSTNIEEFRQQVQGQQKEYLQEEFKQKFKYAGNLASDVAQTTVTYLDKPQKRSKWDMQ